MSEGGHGDGAGAPVEVVRRAWFEALAPAVPDAGLNWAAAGADSLRSLHLLLGLQSALGRTLSFDIIDPDMTIADLVARLARDDTATDAQDAAGVPRLFLVPGMFGDEPILADFRRWFGGRVRFEVVELPDVDAPSTVHLDMARIGDAIARTVARRQPEGAIRIAGYSFGGAAAYEAARVLLGQGREVAALCILDTPLHGEDGRADWEDRGLDAALRRAIKRALAGSDRVRRLTLAATARWRPGGLVAMRRRLLYVLRVQALGAWRPGRLPVPLLLVASGETRDEILANWSRLLPEVPVLKMPGAHRALFGAAAMAQLGPAVLAALGAAG